MERRWKYPQKCQVFFRYRWLSLSFFVHIRHVCYLRTRKKVTQVIRFLKTWHVFKKLGSKLRLLFRKADIVICFLISSVLIIHGVCVGGRTGSNSRATQFYLSPRKGDVIKKKSWALSHNFRMISGASVKCFSGKFQFSVSKRGHWTLNRPAFLKALSFVVERDLSCLVHILSDFLLTWKQVVCGIL